MKNPPLLRRPATIPPLAMMLLSMLIWTLLATGCGTTKVDQISSDRFVVTVNKGVPFTPPDNGKFVPDARWTEMMDVYIRASFNKPAK